MNLIEGIFGFHGEYRFLSNFWIEDECSILFEGVVYPTTEHAYQAAKSIKTVDRALILSTSTPGKAKRAGQQITLRDDWDNIKDQVMYDICKQKFTHPVLRQKLLDTEDLYLEETNTWGDIYWGICKGKGQNKLGLILMKIREELK